MNQLSTFIFLLVAGITMAQQQHITGSVISDNGESIGYANILLLKARDSTIVSGTMALENGHFKFDKVPMDSVIVKATFVGFKDAYSDILVVDNSISGLVLTLRESTEVLDEIYVMAKRPTIQQQVDRLVFNVENTIAATGNTYDILRRTPSVMVVNDEIKVRNQPAVIYINDRKVYLTAQELKQLLEGFSGENVKSVEVITNPPAKYDAEGGSVINIVTSKNPSIGYKGSLQATSTQSIYGKNTLSTSHYYKTNGINAFVNYSYNNEQNYKQDDSRINYTGSAMFEPSSWYSDFKRDEKKTAHSVNAIIDFALSEKNSLSFTTNALLTPRKENLIRSTTEIYGADAVLDSIYWTNGFLDEENLTYLAGLDYSQDMGEASKLTAKANFIYYDDERRQDVSTSYVLPNGDNLTHNSFYTLPAQNSRIYTSQVDYTTALGKWSVETGIKYAGINSESKQDFMLNTPNNQKFNGILSDNFKYTENIYAAYLSTSRNWEKWSVQGGLRAEYTDALGNSITLGKVNSQKYLELFPTFYALNTINDKHSLALSYSRRISRPRFQSLNPYRYYINENSYNQGNPFITAGIYNKVKTTWTFMHNFSLSLYYDWNTNPEELLPFQDNENRVLRYENTNMRFQEQFSLDATYYEYLTDWWLHSSYTSLFTMKNRFIAEESGMQEISLSKPGFFMETYNQLTLNSDQNLSAEVITYFFTNYISGSYTFDRPQFGLTVGFRKTYFNDRLSMSVNFEDIFNTMNIPQTSRYLNQDNSYFAKPESQKITFSLRYRFGNFKLQDNDRDVEPQEATRLEEKTIN